MPPGPITRVCPLGKVIDVGWEVENVVPDTTMAPGWMVYGTPLITPDEPGDGTVTPPIWTIPPGPITRVCPFGKGTDVG
jgi:hypothetical protein